MKFEDAPETKNSAASDDRGNFTRLPGLFWGSVIRLQGHFLLVDFKARSKNSALSNAVAKGHFCTMHSPQKGPGDKEFNILPVASSCMTPSGCCVFSPQKINLAPKGRGGNLG